MVFSCVMCGIGLQQCKERRVLYSKESCHVVSTAVDLLSECVTCGGDTTNIECLLKAGDPSNTSYICKRPCFSFLERIQKLEREVEELRESMKVKLKVTHRTELRKRTAGCRERDETSGMLSDEASERVSSQLEGQTYVQPLPAKKRLIFTASHNESSPVVAVSLIYIHVCIFATVFMFTQFLPTSVQLSVVTKKTKNRIIKGTPMKKLARSIAGGKACTIAKRSLALPSVKSCIVKLIGKMMQTEMRYLCADKFPSVHRDVSREKLEQLSLDPAFEEMSQHAPILTTVLMESCPAKKDHEKKKLVVVVCAAAMLKFRNPNMKLLPSIFSLVLQAGHAGRQVKIQH